MTESWKKLSTTDLLKHPRVPVVEDTVELPDGTKTFYARIPGQDAVSVMLRRADGKFLLNQEYRYATDERIHRPETNQPHNGQLLHFPGGVVSQGESAEAACQREVSEETGIQLAGATMQLLASIFNYFPRKVSRDYKFFVKLPEDYRRNDTQREREETNMQQLWLSEDEIDQLIISSDQRIMHAHILDSWALYKAKKTLLS